MSASNHNVFGFRKITLRRRIGWLRVRFLEAAGLQSLKSDRHCTAAQVTGHCMKDRWCGIGAFAKLKWQIVPETGIAVFKMDRSQSYWLLKSFKTEVSAGPVILGQDILELLVPSMNKYSPPCRSNHRLEFYITSLITKISTAKVDD